MYTTISSSRTGLAVLFSFLALVFGLTAGSAFGHSAGQRRPQRLHELGRRIDLKATDRQRRDGAIVITNDSLQRNGGGGTLTVAEPAAGLPEQSQRPQGKGETNRREHWQKKVEAQRRRVDRAEHALRLQRERVRTLSNAAFDAGHSSRAAIAAWARVEREQSKLDDLEEDLRKERAVLNRIIREARQDGAQPGWFR